VGNLRFHTNALKFSESFRKQFSFFREQSQLLLSNALFQYSKYKGNFRVEIGKPITYNPLYFHNGSIRVPNAKTREHLLYAVDLFAKRYKDNFEKYKDLAVVPARYESIYDFLEKKGEIVMRTGKSTIRPPDYTIHKIPTGNYYKISGIVYRLGKTFENISDLPRNVRVFVPQTRQIYEARSARAPFEEIVLFDENGVKKFRKLVPI
jgi:hypothetical protein